MANKKIVAWALYDLANTAFTSPFATIFWPLLVVSYAGGNEFQIGATVSISILIFSLIIPILGIISDNTNLRKPFIVIPTLVMILIIGVLPWTNLYWNLVLAGIATVMYNLSLSIYNSILPTLGSEEEIGKISGIGMASGFIGTILSLFVAYLTLNYFASHSLFGNFATKTLETEIGVKAVFPVVSIFFLIFSLPFMFIYKDDKVKKLTLESKKIISKIAGTLKGMFRIKGMLPFMIFLGLISNAFAAIDIFFFLYAKKEVGMMLSDFIFLFMAQSVGACCGALIFGKLSDKYGSKSMLRISTVLWIIVIGAFIISKNMQVFWIAGLAGSIALGASLANSRTLFVFISPSNKMGEFFGYSQIISRLLALFGPFIGGWLIIKSGYNSALVMIIGFIVASLFFLEKTPDFRARKQKIS